MNENDSGHRSSKKQDAISFLFANLAFPSESWISLTHKYWSADRDNSSSLRKLSTGSSTPINKSISKTRNDQLITIIFSKWQFFARTMHRFLTAVARNSSASHVCVCVCVCMCDCVVGILPSEKATGSSNRKKRSIAKVGPKLWKKYINRMRSLSYPVWLDEYVFVFIHRQDLAQGGSSPCGSTPDRRN